MNKYVLFFAILTTSLSFSQSAWTKKKGETYTQLSYTTIANYDMLFGNPNYQTERKITDNTIQLYGEYGMSDKTTLIVSVPIKLIKTGNFITTNTALTATESKTSLGNIELGIRHNFYNKKWVISGQLNIEANTSSYSAISGIRTGYNAWSITPTINFGRGFNNLYVQGFTGLNLKTNNYSSSFKIGAEIGLKPVKNIWLIGYLDILTSFKNGDVSLPTNNILSGLYVNNQEYAAFGFKAIAEISNNFGVNAGLGGALSGNNVAKKAALTFGLYHKF